MKFIRCIGGEFIPKTSIGKGLEEFKYVVNGEMGKRFLMALVKFENNFVSIIIMKEIREKLREKKLEPKKFLTLKEEEEVKFKKRIQELEERKKELKEREEEVKRRIEELKWERAATLKQESIMKQMREQRLIDKERKEIKRLEEELQKRPLKIQAKNRNNNNNIYKYLKIKKITFYTATSKIGETVGQGTFYFEPNYVCYYKKVSRN